MTQIATIQTARAQRLKSALESLATWAEKRAHGEHDTETTLTMLKKRVEEIDHAVYRAGVAAGRDWQKKQKAEAVASEE